MSRAIIKADSDFDILHQNPKFREALKLFTRDEDILLKGTTRDWLVVNHPWFEEGERNALDFTYEKEGWGFVVDYGSQRYYRKLSWN